MEKNRNKELVINMYETVLNQKKTAQVRQFVAKSYIAPFTNANKLLFDAFPDIHFSIKEIFAEKDKVITLYGWTGTHQNNYGNISATHKRITVEGLSIYHLKNGKIISNTAKPDKLDFFMQLGVIPKYFLEHEAGKAHHIYFIDEFLIPQKSFVAFKEKLDYNRNFIKNLSGFITDHVLMQKDDTTTVSLMTIAIWKDEESLNKAKEAVQSEYARISFNPTAFTESLDIKMQRRIYLPIK